MRTFCAIWKSAEQLALQEEIEQRFAEQTQSDKSATVFLDGEMRKATRGELFSLYSFLYDMDIAKQDDVKQSVSVLGGRIGAVTKTRNDSGTGNKWHCISSKSDLEFADK